MIWVGLLACVFISFLFSGIESGVLSVNRVRLRHHARRGEEAAMKLDAMLLRLERLMITVVLVTNGANIIAVTLLYTEFTRLLGPPGVFVALAVALPLFTYGLEFLPKAIFRRFPYRTLVIFARILTTAHWLFAPLVNFAAGIIRPIFQASRETVSGRIVAVEDLQRALTQDGNSGQFSAAERALMGHIVNFRPLRAGDLMEPLDSVPQASPEMTIERLLREAAEANAEQFLVIESDGAPGGLVRVTDLLLDGVRAGRVQSYVRRVVAVAVNEHALETLRKLRAARLPLAVVMDNAQKPVGVLSGEQLVRRLLGGEK
ncbi:MAG: CNNM domain-containing protein [Chthoniobacterales bacterium]